MINFNYFWKVLIFHFVEVSYCKQVPDILHIILTLDGCQQSLKCHSPYQHISHIFPTLDECWWEVWSQNTHINIFPTHLPNRVLVDYKWDLKKPIDFWVGNMKVIEWNVENLEAIYRENVVEMLKWALNWLYVGNKLWICGGYVDS